jgi:hypothetical protein
MRPRAQVVARHAASHVAAVAVGNGCAAITVLRSDSSGSSGPCGPCGPDPTNDWRGGAADGAGGVVRVECEFEEGAGPVLVEAAAPKTAARMREKKRKYGPPHPECRWPLSANILDPVRASVVCTGASQLLQVALQEAGAY